MKLFYSLSQKYKTAFLLLIVIVTVLLTTLWGKSTVTKIDESFSSIYKDRLIPANEMFHISDRMYQRRLILTEYLEGEKMYDDVFYALMDFSNEIDSIIVEYEKTYLVDEEDKSLAAFKAKLNEYNKLENQIITSDINKAEGLEDELDPVFNDLRKELITISQIQTTIGKQLMDDSRQMKANSSLLHYCQMGIILVIIIIIQSIIFSAKSIIPKKQQKYKLN